MYSTTNSTCVGYSSSIMYLLYHDISQERERDIGTFLSPRHQQPFSMSDARRTHNLFPNSHPPHPDTIPPGPTPFAGQVRSQE